jgi:L-ascorbate 6-phosphate lactonase
VLSLDLYEGIHTIPDLIDDSDIGFFNNHGKLICLCCKINSAMKQNYLILFLTICLNLPGFSQNKRMIDEIRDHNTGTAVWWAGNDSWIIKSGNLTIATDLYLEEADRIAPCPVTPEEIAGLLDISFITHGHGDHFNDYTTRILLAKSSCLFVIPESCLARARKLMIPDNRIIIAKPREPFEVKGIKVTPLRAIHGNMNFAIYFDANLQDCGYLFTIEGRTFLQPGDTYLLEDHLFLKKVDVLFFSPTEHNTYIDPSVIMINTLDPDYIFPQHHGTIKVADNNYWWTKGYPREVYMRLSQPLKDKYHILVPGDMMEIK